MRFKNPDVECWKAGDRNPGLYCSVSAHDKAGCDGAARHQLFWSDRRVASGLGKIWPSIRVVYETYLEVKDERVVACTF